MIAAGLSKTTMLEAAELAVARCRELAAISDVAGGTTRTFLSEGMRRANERVARWMGSVGLHVRVDAAGNLRGRLPGGMPGEGTFVLASHLDTVPNAGAFDGVLGVMMALALSEQMRAAGLPFALEVIAFSEEEGVRFGVPFLGSRALVGELDEALLARVDEAGLSVGEVMLRYGLRLNEVPAAQMTDALGYLEFHIEQGPALESEGLPIGVVETVAGQSRLEVVFTGRANHAGTTPMHLRQDAMCAAAAWIVAVEAYARRMPGAVATVGSILAWPGAGNVIAGEVRASLDVRSATDAVREDAVRQLLAAAREAGASRGVAVAVEERMQQAAVPMDRGLLRLLEDAVDATGTPVRRMVSGAGHDAMVVAAHMPAAMLFVRSPGGVSHHPDETVLVNDVALALKVGVAFLHALTERERAA